MGAGVTVHGWSGHWIWGIGPRLWEFRSVDMGRKSPSMGGNVGVSTCGTARYSGHHLWYGTKVAICGISGRYFFVLMRIACDMGWTSIVRGSIPEAALKVTIYGSGQRSPFMGWQSSDWQRMTLATCSSLAVRGQSRFGCNRNL